MLSNGFPVLSGVPQGSVLGPLLFLIYIDDVTSEHLSQDSMLNLFADDMLLFKPITSVSDFHHLQDDIESIQNWSDSNYLSLNTKKCKCMLVSRKRGPRQPLSFKLGGDALEQVQTLGVLISSSLSWSPHVEAVCIKARNLLGLVYRIIYGLVDTSCMIEIYKIFNSSPCTSIKIHSKPHPLVTGRT